MQIYFIKIKTSLMFAGKKYIVLNLIKDKFVNYVQLKAFNARDELFSLELVI